MRVTLLDVSATSRSRRNRHAVIDYNDRFGDGLHRFMLPETQYRPAEFGEVRRRARITRRVAFDLRQISIFFLTDGGCRSQPCQKHPRERPRSSVQERRGRMSCASVWEGGGVSDSTGLRHPVRRGRYVRMHCPCARLAACVGDLGGGLEVERHSLQYNVAAATSWLVGLIVKHFGADSSLRAGGGRNGPLPLRRCKPIFEILD